MFLLVSVYLLPQSSLVSVASTKLVSASTALFSPGAMLPSAIWMHPMPCNRDRREISAFLALCQLSAKFFRCGNFYVFYQWRVLSPACSITGVFYHQAGVFYPRRVLSLACSITGVFSHRRIQSPAYSVNGVFSHQRIQVTGVFSHQRIQSPAYSGHRRIQVTGASHLPAYSVIGVVL